MSTSLHKFQQLKIGDVCIVNPRKDISQVSADFITFVPMESASPDGQIDTSKIISIEKAKNYTFFKEGDILFAKITPCMENGKGGIAKGLLNGYGAGSTEFIVLRPDPAILINKWLSLFLSQKSFRHECLSHTKGSAGQKRVPPSYIANCSIPIPSTEEQERIISKIEELFSEIDNAVSSLKAAKRKLAAYRHAILKSVFNNTSPKRKISELSTLVTSGSRGWAKYYSPVGVRFIRITDLTRDKIILDNSNIQRVKLPKITEGKRSKLQGNDILISITADLGSIALVPCDIEEAYINQHIALVRFSEPKLGKLAAWYLKSEYGQKDLLKNKRGGGKLGLGLDDIRNTPIPDIPIYKAESIVGILEERFSVCDEVEKVIGKSLQESTALKQSILKKAFEGELV